jgi:cell division protein YceG involved in septum cleavage
MTFMKKWLMHIVLASVLALAVAADAWAQTLDEAASQAARQYNAKVLSARTVQEGDKRVHVIKLLTKDGVVKTVRVTVRDR